MNLVIKAMKMSPILEVCCPLFKMQDLAGKMLKVQDLASTAVCYDNRLFIFSGQ